MTYRLSEAQIRADYAILGSLTAVGRKRGVDVRTIRRRTPDLRGRDYRNPESRAAFLHSIGLTIEEAVSATGADLVAVVFAIRARHERAVAARVGR